MTDRPDAQSDTAAWDDFDPVDSTLDWVTNTSPPSGLPPQRGPSRGNEAGQPSARPPQREADSSRTLFGDRPNPSGAAPPSGPQPGDVPRARSTAQSDRPPQPSPDRPPAPSQGWQGPQAGGEGPSPQQVGHSYTDSLSVADLVPARTREPSGGWRRLVFKASFGLINPGPSTEEIGQRELEAFGQSCEATTRLA
jgi:hypothetical protein